MILLVLVCVGYYLYQINSGSGLISVHKETTINSDALARMVDLQDKLFKNEREISSSTIDAMNALKKQSADLKKVDMEEQKKRSAYEAAVNKSNIREMTIPGGRYDFSPN